MEFIAAEGENETLQRDIYAHAPAIVYINDQFNVT